MQKVTKVFGSILALVGGISFVSGFIWNNRINAQAIEIETIDRRPAVFCTIGFLLFAAGVLILAWQSQKKYEARRAEQYAQ